jgi:predicted kinase
MHAIVLCGLQACGKSSFCRQHLFHSHVRLSLDMLKTRHREHLMLQACIDAKQPFVVDNTNPTRADRAVYIAAARGAGFRLTCYYFESRVGDSLTRNAGRAEAERVPVAGVLSTAKRLEIPARDEGFDELYYVRLSESGFDIQEWRDEV